MVTDTTITEAVAVIDRVKTLNKKLLQPKATQKLVITTANLEPRLDAATHRAILMAQQTYSPATRIYRILQVIEARFQSLDNQKEFPVGLTPVQ